MQADPTLLRDARNAANLSQQGLADELTERLHRTRPVHFTTISRIESGVLPVADVDFIAAWAGACGIGDYRALLDADGYEPSNPLEQYVREMVVREVARALKEQKASRLKVVA